MVVHGMSLVRIITMWLSPGWHRDTMWLHIFPVFSQLVDTGIQLEALE